MSSEYPYSENSGPKAGNDGVIDRKSLVHPKCEGDPQCWRLGFSQPCVRCLAFLAACGVHRVIYSTGEEPSSDGEDAWEVREVREATELRWTTSCAVRSNVAVNF